MALLILVKIPNKVLNEEKNISGVDKGVLSVMGLWWYKEIKKVRNSLLELKSLRNSSLQQRDQNQMMEVKERWEQVNECKAVINSDAALWRMRKREKGM